MQVADREAGVATEPPVDGVRGWVRDRHPLAGGRGQVERRKGVAHSCFVVSAGACVHQFSLAIMRQAMVDRSVRNGKIPETRPISPACRRLGSWRASRELREE